MSHAHNEEEIIEVSTKEVEHSIKLGKALHNLERNPDFKLLFIETYQENEAIRLTHIKGDPNMFFNTPDAIKAEQGYNEFMLNGIAAFSSFIRTIRIRAEQAKRALEEYKNQEADDSEVSDI